jgi:hypothetical protein
VKASISGSGAALKGSPEAAGRNCSTARDGIYFYKVHVDWNDTSKTTVSTPQKIAGCYFYLLSPRA